MTEDIKYNLKGAIEAGVPADEIATHFDKKYGVKYNFKGAIEAGVSADDIMAHLNKKRAAPAYPRLGEGALLKPITAQPKKKDVVKEINGKVVPSSIEQGLKFDFDPYAFAKVKEKKAFDFNASAKEINATAEGLKAISSKKVKTESDIKEYNGLFDKYEQTVKRHNLEAYNHDVDMYGEEGAKMKSENPELAALMFAPKNNDINEAAAKKRKKDKIEADEMKAFNSMRASDRYTEVVLKSVFESAESLATGAGALVDYTNSLLLNATGLEMPSKNRRAAMNWVVEKMGEVKEKAFVSDVISQKEMGFDVTDGISASDVKGMLLSSPKTIADMFVGASTGFTNYALMSVADNAKEFAEYEKQGFAPIPIWQEMGVGLVRAGVQQALEKVGFDAIFGKSAIGKKMASEIVANVLKEGVEMTAKTGAKLTNKALLDLTVKEVSKMGTRRIMNAATKGFGGEAITEMAQQVSDDGIKLLYNKISKNRVFDEEDIKVNFIKNVINAGAFGGVFGGFTAGIHNSFTANSRNAIVKELAENTNLVEAIDKVGHDINAQVEVGNLTPEEAEILKQSAKEYGEIASKFSDGLNADQRFSLIKALSDRDRIIDKIEELKEEAATKDEMFQEEYKEKISFMESALAQKKDFLGYVNTGVKPEYEEVDGKFFSIKGDKRQEITKEHYDIAKGYYALNKSNNKDNGIKELPNTKEEPISLGKAVDKDSAKIVEMNETRKPFEPLIGESAEPKEIADNATVQESAEKSTDENNAVISEAEKINEVAEKQRKEELLATMPDINISFPSSKKIVSLDNAVEVNAEVIELKKEHDTLKDLIGCLWQI